VRYIGVDGCHGGWIAVTIEGPVRRCELLRRFADIERLSADRVLVDMPIGLPESGYRDCDVEARKMLGDARSRVFLGARRRLLSFLPVGYAEANSWARADNEKGISRQLWCILPKIADVDAFVTPEKQAWLLEAHPELTFQRFNGESLPFSKKKPAGRRQRRDLVARAGFEEFDAWLGLYLRKDVSADDLLDACILAHAASDPRRVECPRATDTRGLAMDIWF
jgi:predicted RNase H-like nuclease